MLVTLVHAPTFRGTFTPPSPGRRAGRGSGCWCSDGTRAAAAETVASSSPICVRHRRWRSDAAEEATWGKHQCRPCLAPRSAGS
jgi:hypothetical protein